MQWLAHSCRCTCQYGYGGRLCEALIDPCITSEAKLACATHGLCVADKETDDGYSCRCVDGYTGWMCEIPPKTCE